ncbi:MAG: energy transducer TonB [Sphingomicrobium sp.]
MTSCMYRTNLNNRDKSGAIAAVIAIHFGLAFALLHMSGTIDLAQPQRALEIFDLKVVKPPPPPPPPPVHQSNKAKPKAKEGAASPKNIKSEATPVVAPKPAIELPVPPKIAVSETPREGAAPTQGASDVRGPGTGAGGVGTGTGSGGAGNGNGGGGDGGYVEPPRLLTPVLRGRDFPRGLLSMWPRGAQVFMRFRIDPSGRIIQCFVDRGTGNPTIDSELCRLTQLRFRYRPAFNRYGQPVAGWAGYRQTPPN